MEFNRRHRPVAGRFEFFGFRYSILHTKPICCRGGRPGPRGKLREPSRPGERHRSGRWSFLTGRARHRDRNRPCEFRRGRRRRLQATGPARHRGTRHPPSAISPYRSPRDRRFARHRTTSRPGTENSRERPGRSPPGLPEPDRPYPGTGTLRGDVSPGSSAMIRAAGHSAASERGDPRRIPPSGFSMSGP